MRRDFFRCACLVPYFVSRSLSGFAREMRCEAEADGCKARRAGHGSCMPKRRSADALQTRNPKGRLAFWHSADLKVEPRETIFRAEDEVEQNMVE